MLATLDDVRKWIAGDKLEVDDVNVQGFQIEATRIIKSSLSGVFQPTTLHSWDTPETTPAIIRSIAGELIAAYLYRDVYSEDTPDVPEYAQTLYNEAISMLRDIRTGSLIVVDTNDVPIEENQLDMDSLDFYPNDSAPGPYFTMDKAWS